jgi:hypothetical protein
VVRFRPDTTAPTDSGGATLLLNQPDGSWRYETHFDIGGQDTVATVRDIPAGGYQVQAHAIPIEGRKWWNAPVDSTHVVAGKTSVYLLQARASR